jgi:tRNA(adenine34) deaminase
MSVRTPEEQARYGINDSFWMRTAIHLAKLAAERGERPFGCVIVEDATQLHLGVGAGSETPTDPTQHSEIDAIKLACKARNRLLRGCTLYSTHEPCLMCTGAILHAKVSRVVWGSSRANLPLLFRKLNVGVSRFVDTSHPPEVVMGVLSEECIALFDGEIAALGGNSRSGARA